MVPGGPENRCKAYINDLKTISATVRTENGAIKVKLAFESDGVELITNCYNNGCCEGNPFCPGAGCPDYELNNSKIDISIIPRIAGGRLTYDSDVNFYVEVAESGYNDPCKNSFWAFLCDLGWVPNRTSRENKIKQGIDTQIRNWFQNDASIRLALETLLNSNINVSGYSTITIDGSGNIVLN